MSIYSNNLFPVACFQLASCGAPTLLCELVGEMMQETELMFNITRILAKISLHESLRAGINSDKNNVLNLVDLLNVTARKMDFRLSSWSSQSSQLVALLVRVSFTLGNLTASNERNRMLIGIASGDDVVGLLRLVFDKYVEYQDERADANEFEEVSLAYFIL